MGLMAASHVLSTFGQKRAWIRQQDSVPRMSGTNKPLRQRCTRYSDFANHWLKAPLHCYSESHHSDIDGLEELFWTPNSWRWEIRLLDYKNRKGSLVEMWDYTMCIISFQDIRKSEVWVCISSSLSVCRQFPFKNVRIVCREKLKVLWYVFKNSIGAIRQPKSISAIIGISNEIFLQ